MYLRHTTIRKNGKTHRYWRLVRSVRIGRKVRQETVAQLGELDDEGRIAARHLAESLMGVERQPGRFDDDLPAEPIHVNVRGLQLERNRRFGDVWRALRLWQALGLGAWLAEQMPPGREDIPWDVMAAVLAIARLCEPSSELHIAEDWFRRTALDDLLGLPVEKVDDDRLYRALDWLRQHKDALEIFLQQRLGTLFKLEYDRLLYDVTSTYFEGQAATNTLAARGHSRDHRPDCKPVCIGLVVTRAGYPLAQQREGCYLLRSNVSDWTAEEWWTAYMQLTEAQAAFRIPKDNLKLRPVGHQKTERVQAHLLVCFLAYVLRKTLQGWSKRAGLGSSLTTILEEFARIDSTDVTLPTTDGRTLRLRCVVRPDQVPSILLARLGLDLPHRLRPPRGISQM
jgi:hypothetical protein